MNTFLRKIGKAMVQIKRDWFDTALENYERGEMYGRWKEKIQEQVDELEAKDEASRTEKDNEDCIVIDEVIYSFNYKFEDLLNMDKTMQKVKTKALEKIFELDAFENKDEFEQMARAYKAPRTFITLKSERVNRIKNKTKRKAVSLDSINTSL